ncbi:MAG TPA: serpin family protein [Gemmatimonadaceae bacterium]
MMRSRRRVRSLLLLAVVGCADTVAPVQEAPTAITALPRALTPGEQDIIDASGAFAFDLFREVNKGQWLDRNVFISPLSASMALGMAMNGAAGTTFDEMRQTLGFGTRPLAEINQAYRSLIDVLKGLDPMVKFELANAIWYDTRFGPFVEPEFLADVRTWFDAEVGPLEMGTHQSVTIVNDWAKQHTKGKIDDVIQDTEDLVMLLANAIYFKGDWRDRFDKAATKLELFTTLSGAAIDVPMMNRYGPLRTGYIGDALVLDQPYGGDAYSMTVIVPFRESVNDLIERLTADDWRQVIGTLQQQNDVPVAFPKLKLQWSDSLKAPLQRLGMITAFLERDADFSRLSAEVGRDLYISIVKQDTYAEVNEDGTEAAAVTTVGLKPISLESYRADRPFVFVIRERLSGAILFMGKIVDPTA